MLLKFAVEAMGGFDMVIFLLIGFSTISLTFGIYLGKQMIEFVRSIYQNPIISLEIKFKYDYD